MKPFNCEERIGILHTHNIQVCEIDMGNPKYTTFTKLVQGRNFIAFELQVFRHEGRETQSFYADFSICPKPRAAPAANYWSGPESQPSSSVARTQLTAFSQIHKSSAHTSDAWCHSHPLVPIPICDFYFDISEWNILSARVWTPALMLHLTNPCAKRKVLSLTKPKGKIYKTKSLGNYVTEILVQTYQL